MHGGFYLTPAIQNIDRNALKIPMFWCRGVEQTWKRPVLKAFLSVRPDKLQVSEIRQFSEWKRQTVKMEDGLYDE